ncbi:MAG TPA: bifunctional rhamnulose-1-phosphate aldolase/short-chain dehydrogenase [Terriglobia bacterium]|nr:bifunctional rhamnulose-1-phosphate aldolase/short-chain dehydrogenase [Terriglobia bacterium]
MPHEEAMIELRYLQDLWDDNTARGLDEPELLRYRSNLLGADLRITNFGGGNTSSKITQPDPLDGSDERVLWVKGSGGDLGSMTRSGFATLYLDKLHALEKRYRGVAYEDEMVGFYPLAAFGTNQVAASIDTPLHGFLPFLHVDHLHPDWGISLAAAANGLERMEEFNRKFGHHLTWVPWQRPGFELSRILRRAVDSTPQCDGVVLGGHGLFTWGDTQRLSYLNSITMIDHLGQFVLGRIENAGPALFGGPLHRSREDKRDLALGLFPFLRGRLSRTRLVIGSFSDLPEVLRFVNSNDAPKLAHLGTSCPDHFVRTKIRPLYVHWNPETEDRSRLLRAIEGSLEVYRKEYEAYYQAHARADSPAMRDPNPTVVLIPGIGMFSFGKSKAEARITGEFYVNAIHVMEGATALIDGKTPEKLPQAGGGATTEMFQVYRNYVALPLREAFNIEYWKLEEAKLLRMPPDKEFSRKVMLIVGGGSGIGRQTALLAARRGAHVVVSDIQSESAAKVAAEVQSIAGKEVAVSSSMDIRDRDSIRNVMQETIFTFGGIDILINTAAMLPSSSGGRVSDEQWRLTMDVNVTGNYLLADEVRGCFSDQGLPAAIVLTSSANAIVPKTGSEAYDISKAAVNHLVRELAIALAPAVRVNGISPATVVKGSTMFPRERLCASLKKYGIPYAAEETTEELKNKLALYYAQRTLTKQKIDPIDCAEAILFLASDLARCTTGHLLPVDGGLTEAFLR